MTGDTPDLISRLRAQLPRRWFPDDAPVLTALLSGLSATWVDVFSKLGYISRQARLRLVSDGWLDLASADYRGTNLIRRIGESDLLLRARLLPIFRDKATRASVIARLLALTGNVATVIEPTILADTGGYGIAMGYGVAGRYGTLNLPFQSFIDVGRPVGSGIPLVGGYGSSNGGYGAGAIAWSRLSDQAPHVTDADIFSAVADTIPAGSIAWVRLGPAHATLVDLTKVTGP